MAIVTIDGPGGPRTLDVSDPDLVATLEANARRDGVDFDAVDNEPALTVAELRAELEDLGVDVPKGAKKADLVELLAEHQSGD